MQMKRTVKLFGLTIFEEQEERSLGTLDNPTPELFSALASSVTDSGVPVTKHTVLTLTAVWRAVNILSGTIASLPLNVYRKTPNGHREKLAGHPVASLLADPNDEMTDFIFKETMMATLLLWGNSYAALVRDNSGHVVELIPVHPEGVVAVKVDGKRFYNVRIDNTYVSVSDKDIIHVPGLSFDGEKGYSPIAIMAESMGLGLAAQKFGSRFFGSGANMDGVLEVPGKLSDQAFDRLRTSWNERYKGLSKSHNTAILEGGAKYQRIGIPPEDAQFLQTRKFQVAEVARMYGVQPHLLMDLDRATHNNIEHQGIEFVMFTLTPWIRRWEKEINRKLLRNYKDMFVEFNITALLRGDSKARSDYYRTMFSIGAMNPNRIRQLENEPPYEGGDQYFAQGAYTKVENLKSQNNETQ